MGAPAYVHAGSRTDRLVLNWFARYAHARSVAFTHQGKKRGHNEDSILDLPEYELWAVADGMGGHEKGEVASALVVAAIREAAEQGESPDAALNAAHSAINAAAEAEQSNMGSTAVVLALQDNARRYRLAWVGDSRAYLRRAGRYIQLTEDHTVVAELFRRGVLTEEEAERHPERSTLSRAIGRSNPGELEIQSLEGAVEPGDLFVLCSDGLSGVLSDQRVNEILGGFWSLSYRARQLIDETLRAGAPDNISVVLVEVHSQGGDE